VRSVKRSELQAVAKSVEGQKRQSVYVPFRTQDGRAHTPTAIAGHIRRHARHQSASDEPMRLAPWQ
jgi:hypothetical protein